MNQNHLNKNSSQYIQREKGKITTMAVVEPKSKNERPMTSKGKKDIKPIIPI